MEMIIGLVLAYVYAASALVAGWIVWFLCVEALLM
jgi:hypothetical protein